MSLKIEKDDYLGRLKVLKEKTIGILMKNKLKKILDDIDDEELLQKLCMVCDDAIFEMEFAGLDKNGEAYGNYCSQKFSEAVHLIKKVFNYKARCFVYLGETCGQKKKEAFCAEFETLKKQIFDLHIDKDLKNV